MKKLFAILALVGVLASPSLYGQEDTTAAAQPAEEQPTETATADTAPVEEEDQSFHEVLKEQFIAGGRRIYDPYPNLFDYRISDLHRKDHHVKFSNHQYT